MPTPSTDKRRVCMYLVLNASLAVCRSESYSGLGSTASDLADPEGACTVFHIGFRVPASAPTRNRGRRVLPTGRRCWDSDLRVRARWPKGGQRRAVGLRSGVCPFYLEAECAQCASARPNSSINFVSDSISRTRSETVLGDKFEDTDTGSSRGFSGYVWMGS